MKINLLLILILFLSCNKSENQFNDIDQKDTFLIAKQNFNDLRKISRTFTIFSDSSYIFKEIIKETNHSREESFEGFLKIKNEMGKIIICFYEDLKINLLSRTNLKYSVGSYKYFEISLTSKISL